MDCCETKKKENGGYEIKMDRKVLLWIVIGILFLFVLYLTFQVGGSSGAVVQGGESAARSAASSGGMVGGC